MSCMNSSQYNGAYSSDFLGFPRDSLLLYIDIKGYPNLATIVARGSEGVKKRLNIVLDYLIRF